MNDLNEPKELKNEELETVTGGVTEVNALQFTANEAFNYKGDLLVYTGPDKALYLPTDHVPTILYQYNELTGKYHNCGVQTFRAEALAKLESAGIFNKNNYQFE